MSVSALALFVASAAALLTQSCTETSAPKKPTNGMATSPDAASTTSAATPTPPTAPTNLPPPPT
ncbi:MAG TPA: hypothetical protein VFS00_10400 [Polyangiaceae bacterium]|nr:hypothetical protein [Polyangiaceae bacterium]